MTTNTHDVQRRQPERDTLQAELQTYLDSGKMIEILGPTPIRPSYSNHRNNLPEKNSGS